MGYTPDRTLCAAQGVFVHRGADKGIPLELDVFAAYYLVIAGLNGR